MKTIIIEKQIENKTVQILVDAHFNGRLIIDNRVICPIDASQDFENYKKNGWSKATKSEFFIKKGGWEGFPSLVEYVGSGYLSEAFEIYDKWFNHNERKTYILPIEWVELTIKAIINKDLAFFQNKKTVKINNTEKLCLLQN